MPRRIIFPAAGQVQYASFESRAPGPGEIRVRTLYSLMSIGTETTILHGRYDAGTHFAARFSFPQIKTGVQAVGLIEACGDGVSEFAPGAQVFMRMAHTAEATLPAAACSPIPEGLDLKAACWCGLAKTAFRAAHAAPFQLGGEVLILGAGPVGQMALRWAACAGMKDITVADVSPLRLDLAQRGGATRCVQGPADALRATLDLPPGGGFELVVDSTGNPAVFGAALGLACPFGKVVLLGDTGYPDRQHLTSDLMTRGLTLIATHDHHDRGGFDQRRIDALFFHLVRSGAFRLEGLITHEFAPQDCAAAYQLASERRQDALGVLFDWTATD
ncbi:MAG: zinc-binding alcohol dehydrogenase [Steroidobacteraceae bacterium]